FRCELPIWKGEQRQEREHAMNRAAVEEAPSHPSLGDLGLVVLQFDAVVVAALVAVEESFQSATTAGVVAEDQVGKPVGLAPLELTALHLSPVDLKERFAGKVAHANPRRVRGWW